MGNTNWEMKNIPTWKPQKMEKREMINNNTEYEK